MIDAHLENIDRRLANVEQILLHSVEPRLTKLEQILPTLATKEELRVAVSPLATKEELRLAILPLATKEELRLAIAEAVAPLATKDEVQALLRAEHERLRLDMRILIEHQDSKLDLLAEHILSATPKRTEE